ncbi:MAG: M56 family metallopeptidase [Pirellulales bacterium]|nr:M56 family metallopeptidase [Pirellulales bacterium]
MAGLLGALVTHLILSGLVAGCLAGTVQLLSRLRLLDRRPAVRQALWLIVLLKLVTPPVVPVPLLPAAFAPSGADRPAPPIGDVQRRAAKRPAADVPQMSWQDREPAQAVPWPAGLLLVSFAGTAVVLVFTWRQARRLQTILWRVEPAAARVTSLAVSLARHMRLARDPSVVLVEAAVSPLLWVRRDGPVVVLPRRLVDELSEDQLRCVLAHELAHYARRDHWINLFAFAIVALCWWQPVAWWARRELRAAQESCCDAIALAESRAKRRCYAQTLFHAWETSQQSPPLLPAFASGFGGRSTLERRILMVADTRLRPGLVWWSYPLLAAGLALLPCLPTAARESDLTELPAGVQAILDLEALGGQIGAVEVEQHKGRAVYAADLTLDALNYDVRVSAEGVLLGKVQDEDKDDDHAEGSDEQEGEDEEEEEEEEEVAVKLSDLPHAVRRTLKREAGNGEIEEIEKVTTRKRTVYEAEVEYETDAGELTYELTISSKGVLLSKILESEDDEDDDEGDANSDRDDKDEPGGKGEEDDDRA